MIRAAIIVNVTGIKGALSPTAVVRLVDASMLGPGHLQWMTRIATGVSCARSRHRNMMRQPPAALKLGNNAATEARSRHSCWKTSLSALQSKGRDWTSFVHSDCCSTFSWPSVAARVAAVFRMHAEASFIAKEELGDEPHAAPLQPARLQQRARRLYGGAQGAHKNRFLRAPREEATCSRYAV